MKVLISVLNVEEALNCIRCGIDILDVKNPKEGSLGANFPWIIREVVEVARRAGKEVSATVGDLDKAGTASLASYGLSNLGVDYVKVGVFVDRNEKAFEILRCVKKSVDTRVVGACYSDWVRSNTVQPLKFVEVACEAEVDGVMVDTAFKDGTSTFDFMSVEEVAEFIDRSHESGMFCALAGGLNWRNVEIAKELRPDVLGFRSLVCENGRERIKLELVEKLLRIVR